MATIQSAVSAAYAAAPQPGAVRVLQSVTGRTPASAPTMASLSPPASLGSQKAFADYKGTRSIVDSGAAQYARVPDIDVTVGGPDAVNALDQSPILQPPKLQPPPQKKPQASRAADTIELAERPVEKPQRESEAKAAREAQNQEAVREARDQEAAREAETRKTYQLAAADTARKATETRKGKMVDVTA